MRCVCCTDCPTGRPDVLTVRSLTLDHVAGVDHAHLDLPSSGVVVVHGPNEMGKTTLLTAFRLLLSEV
ncbi:MAG: ATP-binding protein, partial [Corynebacterium nuruki]|nr:ATP-binding protein [Corynebacterium nuruki]